MEKLSSALFSNMVLIEKMESHKDSIKMYLNKGNVILQILRYNLLNLTQMF